MGKTGTIDAAPATETDQERFNKTLKRMLASPPVPKATGPRPKSEAAKSPERQRLSTLKK